MWLGIRATMTNTADAALDYLSDLGCTTARELLGEEHFGPIIEGGRGLDGEGGTEP